MTDPTAAARDLERIWLSPVCDECRHLDIERTWCQDPVNECEECGRQPIEFVRKEARHDD